MSGHQGFRVEFRVEGALSGGSEKRRNPNARMPSDHSAEVLSSTVLLACHEGLGIMSALNLIFKRFGLGI